MKKIIIIPILVILFSCVVLANVDWSTWGANGYDGAGIGDNLILWASNYPQASDNLSNVSLTFTTLFTPIVADWNLDGHNEIFYFDSSNIYIYDDDLELQHAINTGGTIRGMGCYFLYYDVIGAIAVIVDNTEVQIWLPVGYPAGDSVELVKTIDTTNNYVTCVGALLGEGRENIVLNDGIDGFAIVDTRSNDVLEYDNAVGTPDLCLLDNSQSYNDYRNLYQNRHSLVDLDNDGKLEYVYGYKNTAGQLILNSYDVDSLSFDFKNQTYSDAGVLNDCSYFSLAVANIGSITSVPEIITMHSRDDFGIQSIIVFDSNGNNIYNVNGNGAKSFLSFPSVANIDRDSQSLNEMCFIQNDAGTGNVNLSCVNSIYEYNLNYNFPLFNESDLMHTYIGIGEYTDNNGQAFENLEVITGTGMYEIDDGNKELDSVMNFTDVESYNYTMVYLTELRNRVLFQKDILLIGGDTTRLLYEQATPSICGNLVCESGESILTCPQDCSGDLFGQNFVRITFIHTEPSIAQTWQNGTNYRIEVTANTTDGSTMQTRMIAWWGETFEYNTGWSSATGSGGTNVYTSQANNTCTSCEIWLQARSTANINLTDTVKLYNINVQTEGVTFEDDSYTDLDFTGEANVSFTPQIRPSNLRDNAILDAIEPFAIQTRLGYDIIWLIIMVTVGLVAFAGINISTKFQNVTMSFIVFLLSEFIMMIIGVKLGFIGLGIFMTLVTIALVIIGIFVGKKFFLATG